MKDIFKKVLDELTDKIKEENFECFKVSEFCCELKNNSKEFTVKYISPCLILEKSNKRISEWFFSEKTTNKDINEIVKDFSGMILAKKEARVVSGTENVKITNETDDSQKCVNFEKMLHKVLQFFPKLKEDYDAKFDHDSSLCKKINFIRDFVIPEILKMINRTRDDNRLERMFLNLCDDYVFGDETTKCIITMLFFNSISNESARRKIREYIPKYMIKVWDASWKIR